MSKFLVKSLDEAYKEKQEGRIQKGSDDSTPNFTTDEAKTLLQVMIEDLATVRVGYYYPTKMKEEVAEAGCVGCETDTLPDVVTPTEDNLNDIADGIYKMIVKKWMYDATTLQVCRKAKFSLEMVKDIVNQVDADYMNESVVGKSLGRSLRKVADSLGIERISDLVKAHVGYSDIEKSGTPFPVRIYAFLKGIEKAWSPQARAAAAKARAEKYSWGTLAHVEFGRNGISGQAVLHPEHHAKVLALKEGESTTFKDEQRNTWKVQHSDGMLHFKGSDISGLKGSVPRKELEDVVKNPKIMKSIEKREDINPKEGKKKYGDVVFADEANKKYPIDTPEHVRAALSYINMEKNAAKYSPEDVKKIKDKIAAAAKKMGIGVNEKALTPDIEKSWSPQARAAAIAARKALQTMRKHEEGTPEREAAKAEMHKHLNKMTRDHRADFYDKNDL